MFPHDSGICVKRKSKKPSTSENKGRGVDYVSRTINVLVPLDERIERVMKLEGIKNFTEWANSAFTRRCRDTEREHGVDAEGNPIGGAQPRGK
jgi:hypothetical protein